MRLVCVRDTFREIKGRVVAADQVDGDSGCYTVVCRVRSVMPKPNHATASVFLCVSLHPHTLFHVSAMKRDNV